MRRLALHLLILVAFTLRLHALGAVPLRWDEGWSIALATLPAPEMLSLTALDVHPPLYYRLLAPWVAIGGTHDVWVRFLSLLAGTLAVPLAAVAAAAWWRQAGQRAQLVGLLAAAYTAIAPAFVYYAGVTRMYALTAPMLFLATWGLAQWALNAGARSAAVAAIGGAAAALYTFYYTGFALAGVFAAALLAAPRAWRRILVVAVTAALLYLPWLTYAVPRLQDRLGARAAATGFEWSALPPLILAGLQAALFTYRGAPLALAVPLVVFMAGALVTPRRWLAHLGVAVLPVLAVLVGAALGAQAHMFAARYTIVATPFIALGLGWAVAALAARRRVVGVVAGLAVAVAVLPTLTGYVYNKTAEVLDAYDPATDWRELAPHSEPGDLVVFNILSLAGAYERYRTAADPPWTYAQLWDPVHESLATAQARLRRRLAERHPRRLWLVLYKGTYSPDSAALKRWIDDDLGVYPIEGWWLGDTLYQGYVLASPTREVAPGADFGHGVKLARATYTESTAPGQGVAVALQWQASDRPDADARVFVHAYAPDGTLVAQHDGFPAFDTRPPTTWQPGETLDDRHGLWIPPGTTGPLKLIIGLYDPTTGQRWVLPDGEDGVAVGVIEVR